MLILDLGWNILHHALCDNNSDAAVVEEKVSYICRIFFNLVHDRNMDRHTPLYLALRCSRFKGVSAICIIDAQVVRDKIICQDTEYPDR